MPGPLTGVRVIDLSSVVMGPYATQILGDLGADVIKVEPPTGDATRLTQPQRHPGMGALALNVNRNKRSVALDLKTETGRDAFLRLVRSADILVTNMRPVGQQVEVPMTDTLLAFNMVEHLAGHTFEPPEGRIGFNRSMTPGHRAVQTRDGWACVLPYSEKNIR